MDKATKPPRVRTNISTHYGAAEKDIYEQVMALAKKMGVSKSRAQLILVREGLKHIDHSEGGNDINKEARL